jgi:hypothetical protein
MARERLESRREIALVHLLVQHRVQLEAAAEPVLDEPLDPWRIRFLASREVRPGGRVGLAGVRRDQPFHDVFGIEDDHAPLDGNISDDLVLVPHEPGFPLVHLVHRLVHGIPPSG